MHNMIWAILHIRAVYMPCRQLCIQCILYGPYAQYIRWKHEFTQFAPKQVNHGKIVAISSFWSGILTPFENMICATIQKVSLILRKHE